MPRYLVCLVAMTTFLGKGSNFLRFCLVHFHLCMFGCFLVCGKELFKVVVGYVVRLASSPGDHHVCNTMCQSMRINMGVAKPLVRLGS